MDKSLKAYAIYHRDFPLPPPSSWMQVVAKGNFTPPGVSFIRPNTGDHIDHLSATWAEITVLYWVWKNGEKTDYVSFPHYRRMFWHLRHDQFCSQKKFFVEPSQSNLEMLVSDGNRDAALANLKYSDCIVPVPEAFSSSISQQFCKWHGVHSWEVFKSHVCKLGSEYKNNFEWFDVNNQMHLYQLFVMRWSDFDEYMQTLETLMFSMHIDLKSPEVGYQVRTPAFLAERFLNLYLHVKGMKKTYCSVALLEPTCG